MIRVYLDWNVFSYLKSFKESKEPYISLERILSNNKPNILIPYTSAHLSDLSTSFKQSEKGKEKTLQDLDYLARITDHHCLMLDNKIGRTYSDIYNIHDYFFQMLDSSTMLDDGLSGLFRETSMADLFSSITDVLKLLPSGIDPATFESLFVTDQTVEEEVTDETPKEPPVLKETFQNLLNASSYLDFLNNTVGLINKYNNEPTLYRSVRNATLEELELSNDYTQSPDPIEEISKLLETSAFKMNFTALSEANIKNFFGDKVPSRFDIFTNYYRTLDFVGYYRDKVFKNMVQDSFHAYYGAHCDFFVTDDNNTYHKARVIYEHFNIETVVCKTQQFISDFYGKELLNSSAEKRITEIIPDIIATGFVLKSSIDDNLNPITVYKVNPYVLSYFNRMQVTGSADKSVSIYLYKNEKNYSSFYFFKEIETVTNRIVDQFGSDLNLKSRYDNDVEHQELKENRWQGRHWQFEKTSIILNIQQAPFGLTLSMNF